MRQELLQRRSYQLVSLITEHTKLGGQLVTGLAQDESLVNSVSHLLPDGRVANFFVLFEDFVECIDQLFE